VRKRAAENRIELKHRLLAHTLQQIGLKTLRTPTATLTLADASLKAIPVAPEDIPARWWKPQPPKLDQDGLAKAIRGRDKALKEAEAIPDPGGTPPGAGRDRDPPSIDPRCHCLERRHHPHSESLTVRPIIPGTKAWTWRRSGSRRRLRAQWMKSANSSSVVSSATVRRMRARSRGL